MPDHRRVAAEVAFSLQNANITPDHCTRTITFYDEENGAKYKLHASYEVCGTCDGRGRIVNPSIDEHGLTQEDFDEDPDFREDYCRGTYDVTCPECNGIRVVLVPDEDNDPAALEAYRRILSGLEDYVRERLHEREMGY